MKSFPENMYLKTCSIESPGEKSVSDDISEIPLCYLTINQWEEFLWISSNEMDETGAHYTE